jgi:hypothetical protein
MRREQAGDEQKNRRLCKRRRTMVPLQGKSASERT